MKRYQEFAHIVQQQLDQALTQETIIEQCAAQIAKTIMNDGILHVFGCGHSQMFGEELCFRTGGLVPVNAIMIPHYNIYPKARFSQLMERTEGFAKEVLNSMYTTPNDTMLIISISGRNPAGIEMAMAAKEKGMCVIGATGLNYSNNVTSRHSSGKLLKDVCDIVLDTCSIKGDAVLEDPKVPEKFCSTSTVVTMTLLLGIIGEAIQIMADQGFEPPIWVSGNLDRGDQVNNEYLRKYKGKIDII
ncbi:MAG: SIS domain-containing protein [Erysipelotrichaceae bacterium]|nr:SIS domain-containing protein [Erysipelotrichaceae bacterium]MDY5252086.1 SIS domain-containing protein [Erysipelotrichaceae bacterium]